MRNKKIKGIITATLITLLLGIYIIDTYKKQKEEKEYLEYKKQIESLKIENVDIDNVKDGEYIGESKVVWLSAKVKIIVKDHQIQDIEILEHIEQKGKDAEKVVARILEKQSLDVDTVTGATYSSKIILKATEDALKKGL
ncbi:FMN-binding domain protein [Gottschalkia acidurici 9a]|uniref:FMN-binding domain protein n=1 Tax=Gottschalkia acidurici (strain ATCC 7906 / DSM 604 / BCRC 14475 / CIP 104303 / KCTC 5404 / NCIMB 10678 / 9a) TaxID=1128398 RepID=K0B3J7_GOTA9|nr:FMN-binding protein [Gottschalkia acidurici]AFS79420.1 FMN-binding domain protein [Gottschalkia acidurici 9a]